MKDMVAGAIRCVSSNAASVQSNGTGELLATLSGTAATTTADCVFATQGTPPQTLRPALAPPGGLSDSAP